MEPPVASLFSSPSSVVDVEQAENHVRELRAFIEKHRYLLDRHIVDFYIADPPPLRYGARWLAVEPFPE